MKIWNKLKAKIRHKIVTSVLFEIKQYDRKEKTPYKFYEGFKRLGANSFFWGNQHFISGRENFEIGENVHIGNNAFIRAEGGITIGDNTHISRNLVLYSINHDYDGNILPYSENIVRKKVSIGKNVWIGMNVCIAPGTTIGDGCIIGMGSTVSGYIPTLSIVASPKCVIIKERNKKHYDYIDKLKRYGGPNGQLYNWGENKLLTEPGDSYLARRSTSTLVEVDGRKAIRKEFLTTEDGKNAFETEKNALIQFKSFNWCPKILDVGEYSITTEYFDNSLRLDQQVSYPKELLGQILWNLFELYEQGYAHMDFHARNIFVTDDGIKFIDFETTRRIDANIDFWESYDILGQGLERYFGTSDIGVMDRGTKLSLAQIFKIHSINDLKPLLNSEFNKRMYDSSINFHTVRLGKERHHLKNPKIYASFDLLYTKIPPEMTQRNTRKRLQRFGIKKETIFGKTILDIGSNIGATLLNLYEYNPAMMLGLEYDQNKVDISRKLSKYNKISNVTFKKFDIEIDEPGNKKFDVVFCLAVIEHVSKKDKLFDLLGKVTIGILYFEGNANSNEEFIFNSLKKVGFNEIEKLGFSDDEENNSNNNRPLFIAKK